MKNKIESVKKPVLLTIFFDLLGVWLGMGVPIFNIMFGFLIGSYLFNFFSKNDNKNCSRLIFKYGLLGAILSFSLLFVIWWPYIIKLFDQSYNYLNNGIPLILYTPKASFIGWLILMLFISPALQLMATLFSAYLKIMAKEK